MYKNKNKTCRLFREFPVTIHHHEPASVGGEVSRLLGSFPPSQELFIIINYNFCFIFIFLYFPDPVKKQQYRNRAVYRYVI